MTSRFLRILLLLSIATVFACLVVALSWPPHLPQIVRVYWQLPPDNSTGYEVPAPDDVTRFRSMEAKYLKTLGTLPRKTYRSSEIFKTKGPPVSEFLPPNSTNNTNVKKILAWTTFFGIKDWIPKTIDTGEKTCISTTEKNELVSSDGVVVHPRDLGSIGNLPKGLQPHQRLIYLLQESPFSTGIDVSSYDGVFNWTATYRRDSEVPFTFFWTVTKPEPMPQPEFTKLLGDILSSKTKLISYMNSNCHSSHTKRLQFIAELNKHVHVDTYGRCGSLSCPRNTEKCTRTMSQYKFYLAMENAHCRDYITEKVNQPLLAWRAVPVVMGGADPSDYERILPPNSYINIAGFSSAKELAEYLTLLDRNPELYAQFHQWRRTHRQATNDHWGDMCLALHNSSLPTQDYSDFNGWYKEDVCKS